MKHRTSVALMTSILLAGGGLLAGAALADDAAVAEQAQSASAAETLQRSLDARLRKDAEAMAADAMLAATHLDLPVELEFEDRQFNPLTLVLVSEL
jgi:hypothetical protein